MDHSFDQFPRYDNPPQDERVRGLLCSDNKGKMQIIAPEMAMVDPSPIRKSTARSITSLPPEETSSVCAIPGYYGLPTVVHEALKHEAQVALATEKPGEYVKATGAQIHQLCQSHVSFEASFAQELTITPLDKKNDEDQILRAVESFTMRRIQDRLDETLHIPPLPEAARRIIELQQNPNHDLQDLVRIIETDPSISAKIMSWANSAMYSRGQPSKTLSDAIMRVLGFDLVFNMALGMAIGATLSLPKDQIRGACPYWVEAVYRAAAMEGLAHQIRAQDRPEPGTCYLAGLLSNFGTLVLGHVFPPQYETICRLREANPQLSQSMVDEYVLELSREVVAATLFELWELPDEVVTAVRYQNLPDYHGDDEVFAHLLAIANQIVDQPMTAESPLSIDLETTQIADELGISEANLNDVATTIVGSQAEFWGLAQGMTTTG
ncbi:MAG: HDOD domain-containing protein [Pseudomonadota bacterium]